jgi:hypothetical protein
VEIFGVLKQVENVRIKNSVNVHFDMVVRIVVVVCKDRKKTSNIELRIFCWF